MTDAPWMNNFDPSSYGGMTNLGLSLLAHSNDGGSFGAIFGKGALGAQQNYQDVQGKAMQLAMQRLQMQQLQQEMPLRMGYLQGLPGALGMGQGQAPNGAPPAGDPNQPPQQSQSAGAPPGAPQGGPPPPQQGQIPPMGAVPQQQNDPMNLVRMGAYGGALGMPGADGLVKAGGTMLQYDPKTATRMKAAESPVTIDMDMIGQALGSGNSQLAMQLYQKMQQDMGALKIADRSGVVTKVGARGNISSFNPETGNQIGIDPSGNATMGLIRGAAPAIQTKAAAEAVGRAAGETVPGVMPDGSGAPTVYPKTDYLPGGRLSGTGPGGAGAPMPTGLPTQTKTFLTKSGENSADYIKVLQGQADSATETNYSLNNMLADAKGVQLGAMAPSREWFMKHFSGIGQQFGIAPPAELSSYQELTKYANKVAFAATRQMGSREAAQIVGLQMQSNPNISLTPSSFMDITNGMKAMNNYVIAKNTALQQSSQRNGGNTQKAASEWTQTIDPRVWDLPLSPEMGAKWSQSIGAPKIATAFPHLQPDEQLAALRNMPPAMQAKVVKLLPTNIIQQLHVQHQAESAQ